MSLRRKIAGVVLVAALVGTSSAAADPGQLDPSFGGGDGRFFFNTGPHGGDVQWSDYWYWAGVFEQDRLAAGGSIYRDENANGAVVNSDMAFWASRSTGASDRTVSRDGRAEVPFDLIPNGDDTAFGGVPDPDGGWYVFGAAERPRNNFDIAVANLTPRGALDRTWAREGADGKLALHLTARDSMHAGVVLDDGTLVLGGGIGGDAGLVFLNPDGTLKTDAGTGGVVRSPFGGPGPDDLVNTVLDPATGNIIVIGAADGTSTLRAVYDPAGNLISGPLITPPPSGWSDFPEDAALDGSGNLFVTGIRSSNTTPDVKWYLYQYNSSGVVTRQAESPGTAIGTGIAVDEAGRVLIGGAVPPSGPSGVDAFVMRLMQGTPPSFNFDSTFPSTPFPIGPGNSADIPEALAFTPGRALVAGTTIRNGISKPFLAAIQTDECSADLELVSIELVPAVRSLFFPGRPRRALASEARYDAVVITRNNGEDSVTARVELQRDEVLEGTSDENLSEGQGGEEGFGVIAPASPGAVTYSATISIASPSPCADPDATNNAKSVSVTVSDYAESTLDDVPRALSNGGPGTLRATAVPGASLRLATADLNDLAKVQIAVVRLQGSVTAPEDTAPRAGPACYWLKSNRPSFDRRAPDEGVCNRPIWLNMKSADGASWSYRLPDGLPNGKYAAYTRAVNEAGLAEETFLDGVNRRAFTVR